MSHDSGGQSRTMRRLHLHPAQSVVLGFLGIVVVGTILLMLPEASRGPGGAPFITALFTATSATCLTGLITVDTAMYWSPFGQLIILALIQVGGLGIMTIATGLALAIFHRSGLRSRLTTALETKGATLGRTRNLVPAILVVTVAVESITAVILGVRFAMGYGETPLRATWHGIFHAVSAFNNAGFSTFDGNLMRFVADPWINVPIMLAIIIGGLGFPVWMELFTRNAPSGSRTSLHTKMTVSATLILLVGGMAFFLLSEWSNPLTLGQLDGPAKFLASAFQSVSPRTAGFNTLDYGVMRDGTLFGTEVLMFIGGGSAGTAGGIKVTTALLLLLTIVTEARGARDVIGFDRRMDPRVIRQALSVVAMALVLVGIATLFLLEWSQLPLAAVQFEVVSAFGTVGLSTGITGILSPNSQMVLIVLMFLGRVGPITLAASLALRDRTTRHRLPEGRPLIG